MEINWFTVIAQIINFLILVYLLKRFLYKPVLNAIDEREKKIATQLADAAALKADAEKEQIDFRQKNEVFDKERLAKMNEVREEVNLEKQRLLEEVRNESTAMQSKYADLLKQQQQDITDTVKQKTKDEVFAIVGKTLSELANANLEEQTLEVFIRKISDLEGEHQSKLKSAINNNNRPISIKSAFELSASSKENLEKALETITGKENKFHYQIDNKMVGGIELNTESYQLSWNIESYLDSLKTNNISRQNDNANG